MITIQCKSQAITEGREAVSMACGIPMDQLRFIMNPVGGSFGYSVSPNTYAVVATAVQNLNMPCTLTLSYEEFNHMTGKRSATFSNGRLAVSKDGKILAAEYDIGLDHGPYGSMGSKIFNNLVSVGFHGTTSPTSRGSPGALPPTTPTAPRIAASADRRSTPPRRLIDMAAEKIGMDPWEFRYKNVARPGDTTINSCPYHDYVYPELLEKAKPFYDQYKAEAEAAKKKAGTWASA